MLRVDKIFVMKFSLSLVKNAQVPKKWKIILYSNQNSLQCMLHLLIYKAWQQIWKKIHPLRAEITVTKFRELDKMTDKEKREHQFRPFIYQKATYLNLWRFCQRLFKLREWTNFGCCLPTQLSTCRTSPNNQINSGQIIRDRQSCES